MTRCAGRVLFLLLLAAVAGGAGSAWAGIAQTKHNLSATGPGSIKATSEDEICIFCHFPHGGNPAEPLWNHTLSGETYTPYSSGTLFAAAPGQPSGRSKLCLSCHDGTVAVGSVQHMPRGGGGAGVIAGLESTLVVAGSSFVLGTDLSDDHPVSIVFDTGNSELAPVSVLEANGIKLDENGQIQCGSCHNPHSSVYPKFLRKPFTEGGYGAVLCRTCHDKQYWSTVANMPHRESLNQWNGVGDNPWHVPGHNLANDANSTPRANACESCHQPHGGSDQRLVKSYGKNYGISQVCLVCHNGNVAVKKDIEASLSKAYAHPVMDPTYAWRHSPERIDGKVRELPANLGGNRHAQCPDCHNPHAVSAGVSPDIGDVGGTNNLASNVLKGVWGVEPSWPGNWGQVTSFTEVDDIQYQYQLCLKCHSYYAFGTNPPQDPWGMVAGGQLSDQAIEFNPNNASYHPVVAAGKNDFKMTVQGVEYDYSSSLINGMTPSSTMTCSECHSDDGYTGPSGTVPKGPHGSDEWPILAGKWNELSGSGDHPGAVLCYKCHRAEVYGFGTGSTTGPETTGFSGCRGENGNPCGVGPFNDWKNLHRMHMGFGIFSDGNISCMACHSAVPHGMKRRALLVIGRGPLKDPAPYVRHERHWTDYGLPSEKITEIETVPSGNWKRSDCHTGYFCW